HGIILLNNQLKTTHIIPVEKNLLIYSTYKSDNYKKLALYSADDEKMIFIDLNTFKIETTIPVDCILSPNYYWHDSSLIFTSFNDIFYQYFFVSQTLKNISHEIAQTISPSFFQFWKQSQNYTILTVYPHNNSFVFQKNIDTIGFLNYTQNDITLINNFSKGWHDVEYNDEVFAFIHEDKIELLRGKHTVNLKPKLTYIFLKMRFLDERTIVILSSNVSDRFECIIEIYEVDQHR